MHSLKIQRWRRRQRCCVLPSLHFSFTVYVSNNLWLITALSPLRRIHCVHVFLGRCCCCWRRRCRGFSVWRRGWNRFLLEFFSRSFFTWTKWNHLPEQRTLISIVNKNHFAIIFDTTKNRLRKNFNQLQYTECYLSPFPWDAKKK